MSDPYSDLAAQHVALQERVAVAVKIRSPEPEQMALRRQSLRLLNLPEGACAVAFGSIERCGAVSGTSHIAGKPGA